MANNNEIHVATIEDAPKINQVNNEKDTGALSISSELANRMAKMKELHERKHAQPEKEKFLKPLTEKGYIETLTDLTSELDKMNQVIERLAELMEKRDQQLIEQTLKVEDEIAQAPEIKEMNERMLKELNEQRKGIGTMRLFGTGIRSHLKTARTKLHDLKDLIPLAPVFWEERIAPEVIKWLVERFIEQFILIPVLPGVPAGSRLDSEFVRHFVSLVPYHEEYGLLGQIVEGGAAMTIGMASIILPEKQYNKGMGLTAEQKANITLKVRQMIATNKGQEEIRRLIYENLDKMTKEKRRQEKKDRKQDLKNIVQLKRNTTRSEPIRINTEDDYAIAM